MDSWLTGLIDNASFYQINDPPSEILSPSLYFVMNCKVNKSCWKNTLCNLTLLKPLTLICQNSKLENVFKRERLFEARFSCALLRVGGNFMGRL